MYGSGSINHFIGVLNPFSKHTNVNLITRGNMQLQALRVLEDECGEPCPYPIYPKTGGLLPFAITDNGDVAYWLTEGDPNGWKVVLNESRGPEFEYYPFGMSLFIYRFVTGKLGSGLLPNDAAGSPPTFVALGEILESRGEREEGA